MPPIPHHTHTDAAFARAIRLLQKERHFVDAYHLGRVQLERCTQFEWSVLAGFIKNADESGLLNECAEFLVALTDQHPDDATLLNYTAGLLGYMGQRQRSRDLAKLAAARRPFFPSSVRNAGLRVLALQCIATANYKYSPMAGNFFMPGISDLYKRLDRNISVHRLLVDDLPAALEAAECLPECDLVFNTISDPDFEESLRNAATLCDVLQLPVFNPPRQVREMNRASLPGIVAGKSDRIMAARSVFLPPDRSENSDIASAMRENNLAFPVIIRAPGFQGGQQMTLVRDTIRELGQDVYRGDGLYVIEFVDVSFADDRAPGSVFYPKYRAFFANGQVFPIHLFIADHYEVHKKTSDPVHARHPWLPDREADFLRDPAGHLPDGLWDELGRVMASFGLDYFGVDFAVSSRPQDRGRLVLFECNPSMRNWIALLPDGDRVQRQWHRVTQAAHEALCAKGGVDPWPFRLNKGLICSFRKKS